MLRSSSIYVIGSFISSGIPFFLLPILTRYLSPADYGILAIVKALSGLLLNIAVFSQNSSYQRFYYDYTEKNAKSLLFNTIIVVTMSTLLIGTLLGLFQSIIHYNFGFDDKWLIIIVIIAYANSIHLLILGYFQINKQPVWHLTINSTRALLIMLISIFFVVVKGYNWQGRVYGDLIYYVLFLPLGFSFILLNRNFNIKPSKEILRDISCFGGGLVPGALAVWGLNLADRLILNHYTNAATTGLYNIGYQFGFIVWIVNAALGRAWSPFFWENWLKKGEKGKKNIFRTSKFLLAGILLLGLFVSMISPFLLRQMVTPEFYGASRYITLISFGYALQGFQMVFSPYLSYHKKTFQISNIAIASVILNLLLNLFLVPIYGGLGAAMATLLAFLFSLIVHMILAYRLERISIVTIIQTR